MTKYAVLIHGVNFLLRMADAPEPKLFGFYVNAFVETATPEEASTQAIEIVRNSDKLRSMVANAPEDRPRMFVDEISELYDWPEDTGFPLSGFSFYADPDAEWRNEYDQS
jgi:hypothetical protein